MCKKLCALFSAVCVVSAIAGLGVNASSGLRTADQTLTEINGSVQWEDGSFAVNGSEIKESDAGGEIRTAAVFDKQQILIEAEDGCSFKVNEVSAGTADGSYVINRKYSPSFKIPYNEWMQFGYFNVYPDRIFTIEVKKDDGSKLSAAEAQEAVSLYSVDVKNHIPDYYKDYIKEKAEAVNNLQENPDTFSFIFITDIHLQHNTKHFIPLIKELINNCGINDVLGGGDWVTAWLTDADGKQGLRDDYDELTELFEGIPLIKTIGNHDWAWGSQNQYSLTEDEAYDWFYKDDIEKSGAVRNDNGDPTTYFYKDDAENKVRYISLNDMDYEVNADENGLVQDGTNKTWYYTMSDEQIEWLKNTALKLPDNDWDCVIFSHLAIWNTTEAGYNCDVVELRDDVRAVVEGFKTKTGDFADYKGDFIGWFSGHSHFDDMLYYSDNGSFVNVISDGDTTVSSEPGISREMNTVNEQSFQVVTVDKSNKRVYCTRIGAGDDRCFNY